MSTSFEQINGEFVAIARLKGKPGTGDKLVELAREIHKSAMSDKEPGCLGYRVIRFGDEVVVIEKYLNGDAIKAHLETDAFKAFNDVSGDLLTEKPELRFYEELF